MDLNRVLEDERASVVKNLRLQESCLETMGPALVRAAELMRPCLTGGGTVYFFGNGGSAADAQHWAAELTGRYIRERQGLAGVALTTDTSAITAIANDYGFDRIFARQIEALARPGDVAVGISTSGNSPNVLSGLKEARARGCKTVAVLGRDGGHMAAEADVTLLYPAMETPRIQEFHAVIGHLLCALVDAQ